MPSTLLTALATAHRALAESVDEALELVADEGLLDALERAAAVRRLLDARSATLAGEVARRSSVELGHAGLAQRRGHRTAEELVRVTTGSSRHDARVAVRAGSMLASSMLASSMLADSMLADSMLADSMLAGATAGAGAAPGADLTGGAGAGGGGLPVWARALVEPVVRGELSTAALDAIRSGLGDETETVSAAALAEAVAFLLRDSASLDVDRLHQRARHLRDDLDVAGVAHREQARREARSLRVFRQADGMTRATWLLDPESAAVVTDLYDRATSPRRGGPTFLGVDDTALIERMRADDRSPEQYASDAFVELLRAGAEADASALLSTGAPSVRVLVTASDLAVGSGFGHLDGQSDPVSLPSVQRLICAGTHTPILLASTGQPLDVGRSQRLFTARQRVALAARDGGCRWAGCERPPSWCEAHHIEPWSSRSGRTDVADGVLLCRHHHLLVHNNGWRVERQRGPGAAGASGGLDEYWAVPPASGHPPGTPPPQRMHMPSHSAPLRRALRDLEVGLRATEATGPARQPAA